MDQNDLSERIANLSPAKRTLLEQRLKGIGRDTLTGRTIPLRAAGEFAPLSFAQQRLWFLNQLDPKSPVYNEPRVIRITGLLDVEALEKTLNHIVARHEVLRTTISFVDGSPRQRIAAHRTIELPAIDLRMSVAEDRDAEARRLIDETMRRPFDLSNDLMLRVLLLRLGEQEHILLVVKHHVASDGWSSGIFWREVATLYAAFGSGQPANLPELPVQYADYAEWQREWLQGQVLETQLSYWRKQLNNLTTLQLPTDRPRPAIQSFQGARQALVLSDDLSQALKALSRKEGVTLFMTLLAAFQTLLYRYTGQEDIAVGSLIAGRNRSEIEGLIGFFVNTLVLRTDISGNLTFKELVERVRGVCVGAYSHQDVPFEKLVEELQPERNLNSNPLFQVAFQLNSGPRTVLTLTGIKAEDMESDSGISKFDLSLAMVDNGEEIIGCLQYNTDLFKADTIERMLGHFKTLLEGIAANPEQRISELPLLTEPEKHQLLVEWNETKTDYPQDKCIHQLFEEQVEKTPDAVALVFEDQQLTYRELNNRANQLAHYLQKLAVGPEVLVGICVERSIEMVVGLMGILKAGGVYVPLDPSYPKERLAFMLEDAQARVLLTQQKFLSTIDHRTVVCLDRDWQEIAKEKVKSPQSQAIAENLAYVIYTSGSTGTPKGVMIPHRGLVNYLSWATLAYGVAAGQGAPVHSPIGFDLTITGLFTPLLAGRRVKILSQDHCVEALSSLLLRESDYSLIKITPAHLELLGQELPADKLAHCARALVIGGEALTFEKLALWSEHAPETRLINEYGPTETVVGCCVYEVAPGILPTGPVPIGRPIANTGIYILDLHLNLVPIGIPGELHIGGDGLARGYLNRPELTREKFIPNRFSADLTSRLYKTGDLARYLPDGNIEFLGRIDNQVKVRGYRVELGEIESLLCQHPGVREALVLAREESPADRRLVAYVVAARSSTPSAGELRSFLGQKLPEYMVPSGFMFLESLPLTPNGKLDRKALPAPDKSRPELEKTYTAPRTPVELLAQILSDLLTLDKVGIHDNFFELGGHSLLATQVISRVRESFRVELPLRSLFQSPTVAGLAEQMEATRCKEDNIPPFPMVPVARDKDLPLSFAQRRLWFLDQYEPDSSVYNVFSGLRLTGRFNIGALEQSLVEIVRRHESLRTRFSMVEGEPVQMIAPSPSFSLAVVDISHFSDSEREDEAQRLATAEAQRPFDLSQGPLFRTSIVRLGEADHVLLLTMHHIVSDGWSTGVLYRELSVLYQAFSEGKPTPLADLAIQYGDYAVWQREWLKGEELGRQLSYWNKQLEGAPGVLNLSTDRRRPAVQSYRGKRQSITLSKELTQLLKALSRKEGVTLFMTLLAAFQTLLYRYTGQEDIVVGSPIANRTRTEIEGLIGFFVNTLVLRSDLSGNPTFREILARVRKTALEAYEHQDLPFEKLVEELHPERSLSHSPLFQVLFNMTDQGNSKLDLPGLTTERFSFSEAESKYDLTLYVREQNNELHFNLVYRVDLFSESWMTCFLQQYRYLLEQIVSAPEKSIPFYSLVTPESRMLLPDPRAVLAEPLQQLVTNTFLSWAKQTPAQPAVSQGMQASTYEQLAERADTFARVLRVSGLEPGDVVAVHGRRSFGLIAAMIGTLLSGGVLLLLDYSLPKQRKQLMLKEAKARKMLSFGGGGEDTWVNADYALDILSVNPATGCVIDLESCVDLKTISLPEVSPNDPSYIFFTSGTTGIPKAVLGCHKSLSHFLRWQRETFAIGPNDRIAQLTSLSFDAVLRDVFLPLTSGATLCLPELNDDPGSDDTISWLERERISVLHTVPSVAKSWLASVGRPFSLSDMRWVFFVGEPLTDALVRQWRSTFQNTAEIVNLYGPTETTLVKCFYRVPTDMRSGLQVVGSPISDAQALVLAHDDQLCGVNEPGEIVLRTPFRSLGYVNALEESRMRFVKNPFRNDAEDLIYFTGDAGRYRPDGTLEILGRLDEQVKIRGVRVEPAEVTAILSRHPLVNFCILVGKKNEAGETCLVAYVVASKPGQATTTQLRSYLLEQLPAAMVPSVFVFLDSLPLTPNGKVDRKALPEPDHKRSEEEESFVAPRSEIESIVAGIWTEVLKPERIGVHDNFFELGGHSLLAGQIVSRIRGALQVELSLRALFEKPTVAGLCDHIEAIRWTGKKNQRTSKDNFCETEEIML